VIVEFSEGSWDARCDDCGSEVRDLPSHRDAEDALEAHMAVTHGVVELDIGGAAVSETVGMLDHADRTLHRPGNVHLMTACGVHLDSVTLAPMSMLRAERGCPKCFHERSEP
jgi:hypothetical protein